MKRKNKIRFQKWTSAAFAFLMAASSVGTASSVPVFATNGDDDQTTEPGDAPQEVSKEIKVAESADEFADAVSKMPEENRLVVKTSDDSAKDAVADQTDAQAVVKDDVAILAFSTAEEMNAAKEKIAADGTAVVSTDDEVEIQGISGMTYQPKIEGGKGVRIALIDTGVKDMDNIDLTGEGADDDNGHGTKMAEAIRANAPDADIISIKALGKNGRGKLSNILTAVQYAKDQGAEIVNMSFSMKDNNNTKALKKVMRSAGITFVASAGNNGDHAGYYFPANYASTTVGAMDGSKARLDLSNYGPVGIYAEAGSTSEAAAYYTGYLASHYDETFSVNAGFELDDKLAYAADVKDSKIGIEPADIQKAQQEEDRDEVTADGSAKTLYEYMDEALTGLKNAGFTYMGHDEHGNPMGISAGSCTGILARVLMYVDKNMNGGQRDLTNPNSGIEFFDPPFGNDLDNWNKANVNNASAKYSGSQVDIGLNNYGATLVGEVDVDKDNWGTLQSRLDKLGAQSGDIFVMGDGRTIGGKDGTTNFLTASGASGHCGFIEVDENGKVWERSMSTPDDISHKEFLNYLEYNLKQVPLGKIRIYRIQPSYDPIAISIKKANWDNPDGSPKKLSGAVFTLKSYTDATLSKYREDHPDMAKDHAFTVADLADVTPDYTWKLKSNEKGYALLDDSYKAEGSNDLYKPTNKYAAIPYGILTVEETTAPEGYTLKNAVLTADGKKYTLAAGETTDSSIDTSAVVLFNIARDGSLTKVVNAENDPASNDILMEEKAIYGGFTFDKVDADRKDAKEQNPAVPQGDVEDLTATFEIKNNSGYDITTHLNADGTPITKTKDDGTLEARVIKNGEVVADVTTDANGHYESANNALSYGTYFISEKKAPKHYTLSNDNTGTFSITENDKIVPAGLNGTSESYVNRPDRGHIKIFKYDSDRYTTQEIQEKIHKAQGDATLKGAKYIVVNESKNSVYVDTNNDDQGDIYVDPISGDALDALKAKIAEGGYEPKLGTDGVAWVLETDENGAAQTGPHSLPDGTYEVIEISAPKGYLMEGKLHGTVKVVNDGSRDTDQEFQLAGLTDDAALTDKVIRGSAKGVKNDLERFEDNQKTNNKAQGTATLADAEMTVYLKSPNDVYVNKEWKRAFDTKKVPAASGTYDQWIQGVAVETVKTDADGRFTLTDLPYGSYYIVETKAPKGYFIDKSYRLDFQIREDGKEIDMSYEGIPKTVTTGSGKSGITAVTEKVDNSTAKTNENRAEEQVYRSDIAVTKYDIDRVVSGHETETGKDHTHTAAGNATQGDASLKGAEFSIYNVSNDRDEKQNAQTGDGTWKASTTQKAVIDAIESGDAKKVSKLDGAKMAVITTDENGFASTVNLDESGFAEYEQYKAGKRDTRPGYLPYGTYIIAETKAPEGYQLNTKWHPVVTITEDGKIYTEEYTVTKDSLNPSNYTSEDKLSTGSGSHNGMSDDVIRGGVKISKLDLERDAAGRKDADEPQGDASLKNAQIAVWNDSAREVYVAGQWYQPGDIVYVMTTDEDGSAETPEDLLPYGTYHLTEIAAPVGYLPDTDWRVDFKIRESGKYNCEQHIQTDAKIIDGVKEGSALKDQVIRGDVRVTKEDLETSLSSAIGGKDHDAETANLNNIEFTIVNVSNQDVQVDGKWYEPGEVVERLYTYYNKDLKKYVADTINPNGDLKASDPRYVADNEHTSGGDLPYGTYTIQETQTNDSYLLTDGTARIFQIGRYEDTKVDKDYEGKYDSYIRIDQPQKTAAYNGVDSTTYSLVTENPFTASHVYKTIHDEEAKKIIKSSADLNEIEALVNGKNTAKAAESINTTAADAISNTKNIYQDTDHLNFKHNPDGDKEHFIANVAYGKGELLKMFTVDGANGKREIRFAGVDAEKYDGNSFDDTASDDMIFRNRVMRGDLGFQKSDAFGEENIFSLWVLKNETSGEKHVLATDENGMFYSDGTFHSDNTNANDKFLADIEAGKVINIDPSKVGTDEGVIVNAGVWFGLNEDGTVSEVNDDLGSLPYGTYTLTEAASNTNKNYVRQKFTFKVNHDNSIGQVYYTNSEDLNGTAVTDRKIDTRTISHSYHNASEEARYAFWKSVKDYPIELKSNATIGSYKKTGVANGKDITITDMVTYHVYGDGDTLAMLNSGNYKLVGWLADAATGEALVDADGNKITGETKLHFGSTESSVKNKIKFNTAKPVDMAGKTVVVMEDLMEVDDKGVETLVASHEDITDAAQMISFPAIHTTLGNTSTDEEAAKGTYKLTDTVSYSGLEEGTEYTVTGTLMDKKTGKALTDEDGKEITAETTFTAESVNGKVDVVFEVPASAIKHARVVAFEKLYESGTEVAIHADINDKDQTEVFPMIHTTATAEDGSKDIKVTLDNGAYKKLKLVDEVEYEGLEGGKKYTFSGTLHVRHDGRDIGELKDASGNPVTSEAVVTVDQSGDGIAKVVFEFDGSVLLNVAEGDDLVVFEKAVYSDTVTPGTDTPKPVTHEDITDEGQSVTPHSHKDIKVTKTDVSGKELEGAKMAVFKYAGADKLSDKPVDEWVSGKEAHEIKGLDVGGHYVLVEEEAPAGFAVAKNVDFVINDNYEAEQKFNVVDKVVELTKVDAENDKKLPGSHIQIIDKDGKIVDEWTSDDKPHKIENVKVGETYTMHEEGAPDGYYYATDGTFEVTDNGADQKEVMKDIPTKYEIYKIDDHDRPVAGVTLKLTDVTDKDNPAEVELPNKGVTTDKPFELKGRMIAGHTYDLSETEIIDGVYKTQNIQFTVPKNGTDGTTAIRITMVDDTTVLAVKKVDENGNALPGAQMQILEAVKQEDGTYVPAVDDKGQPIVHYEFTSTDSDEGVDVSDHVEGGQTYILRESEAPFGFQKITDIVFTVNGKQGIPQTVVAVDAKQHMFVSVVKADANDASKLLKGAQFTVYNADGTVAKDVNGQDAVGTTDDTGKVTFELPYSEDGYYTVETGAPVGYRINEDKFNVTVADDYNFASDNPIVITVNDTLLPTVDTGVSTSIAAYGAAALALCAVLVILRKKRRNEKA